MIVSSELLQLDTFPTELGWFGLLSDQEEAVYALTFGHRSAFGCQKRFAALFPSLCWDDRIRDASKQNVVPSNALILRLQNYARGESDDFSDVSLSLTHLTPFAKRVTKACQNIPWGETKTYGELASLCKSPNAARAVGSVMAKNRFPLLVPCHRVVPAGQKLGGFSAPQGVSMKKRLLKLEGVERAFN